MKSHQRLSFVFPREGQYRIQVPFGVWHSVVVHEANTLFEVKDGEYNSKNVLLGGMVKRFLHQLNM